MTDYYNILEIPRTANTKEIKKAYRKLAVKWHPDKNKSNDAKQKFQAIAEAYNVLSDTEKKSKYDQFGKAGLDPNSAAGFNPADMFANFFGGGGGNPFGNMGNPFGNMNSPFGRGNFQNSVRRKGPESTAKVQISLKEMYIGCKRNFQINRKVSCNICLTTGLKKGCKPIICEVCQGRGSIIKVVRMGPMISQSHAPCHKCKGNGKIISDNLKCGNCNGVKYIKKKTDVALNIRKGINNNEVIKLKNLGDESENWTEPGDIHFTINIKSENPNMRRVNNDLIVIQKILLSEALSGLEMSFTHLDEREIIISYDEIIKPNKSYRVNNQGFENDGNTGDLIFNFDIIFPNSLDEKRKEIINRILPVRKKKDNNGLKQYNLVCLETNYEEHMFDDISNDTGNPECAQQ